MKMKKNKSLIMFLTMFCVIASLMSSCTLEDPEITFSQYTQQERKDYTVKYLSDTYGLNASVKDDVKIQPTGAFTKGRYYLATAVTDENETIYCWIDEAGNIKDSRFVNGMNDEIVKVFETDISPEFSQCIVKCTATLKSPASKEWTKDQAKQMLTEEEFFVSVKVFIDTEEKETAEALATEKFNGKFNFTSGMIYFYYMDDLTNETVAEQDLTDYDRSVLLEKKRDAETTAAE